jgi:hypothetical protein
MAEALMRIASPMQRKESGALGIMSKKLCHSVVVDKLVACVFGEPAKTSVLNGWMNLNAGRTILLDCMGLVLNRRIPAAKAIFDGRTGGERRKSSTSSAPGAPSSWRRFRRTQEVILHRAALRRQPPALLRAA